LSEELLSKVTQNGIESGLFEWGNTWLIPLYEHMETSGELLGVLGVAHSSKLAIDAEQTQALSILAQRAAQALEDRLSQDEVFRSIESLTPEMEYIQRLRASVHIIGDSHLQKSFPLVLLKKPAAWSHR
jgi:hypothetical protein